MNEIPPYTAPPDWMPLDMAFIILGGIAALAFIAFLILWQIDQWKARKPRR